MKIVKIDQLDGTVEEFNVDKLDKETCETMLSVLGYGFNKITGYWETEDEMIGLEDED